MNIDIAKKFAQDVENQAKLPFGLNIKKKAFTFSKTTVAQAVEKDAEVPKQKKLRLTVVDDGYAKPETGRLEDKYDDEPATNKIKAIRLGSSQGSSSQ